MNLINYVRDGIEGKNKGIPLAFSGLQKHLKSGLKQKTYYLIGAESGVGKSSFTDEVFLLHPLLFTDMPIKVFYFSFEIPKIEKELLWLSYLIYKETGKDLSLDRLSGYEEPLTESEFELVKRYNPVIQNMMEKITFIEEPLNPTGMFAMLEAYFNSVGKVELEPFEINGQMRQRFKSYTPNNPNQYTIIIVDHISLLADESGLDSRNLLVLFSKYMVRLRNRYMATPVIVQQFNAELASFARGNNSAQSLRPSRADFSDSKYPFRDANIVIGGVSPRQYGMPKYEGYQITGQLKDSTFWYVIKNRYGKLGLCPLLRKTGAPVFVELPEPETAKTVYK